MDKAKTLIKKLDASEGGDPSATRVVGDWFVASDKEASIDRVLKGSGTALSDDDQFKAAQAKVSGDALVKAYVNGRQASEAFKSLFGGAAQTTASGGSSPFGLDKLDWLSASLVAKDNGVVLEANVKGATSTDAGGGAPYASKLISGVPADALAFA